jgi:hypothetical protein
MITLNSELLSAKSIAKSINLKTSLVKEKTTLRLQERFRIFCFVALKGIEEQRLRRKD